MAVVFCVWAHDSERTAIIYLHGSPGLPAGGDLPGPAGQPHLTHRLEVPFRHLRNSFLMSLDHGIG